MSQTKEESGFIDVVGVSGEEKDEEKPRIPPITSAPSAILLHICDVFNGLPSKPRAKVPVTQNTFLHKYLVGRDPNTYGIISYITAEVWPDCLDTGEEPTTLSARPRDFVEGDEVRLIIGAKLGGRPEEFNVFPLNKMLDPIVWQQAEQMVYDHVAKGEGRHAVLQYTLNHGDEKATLRILRIYYHFQLYDTNGQLLADQSPQLEGIFENPRPPIRVHSNLCGFYYI